MSTESNDVKSAVSELTHAMAQLLRAIDAVGDSEAGDQIPDKLPEALEELAGRVSAAKTFGH